MMADLRNADEPFRYRIPVLFFVLAGVICAALWIGGELFLPGEGLEPGLVIAFFLNLINGGVYFVIALILNRYKDGSLMERALGLLAGQLFVNTFTIFFLIGLHTVNVRVLISAFCTMYVVHMTCAVLAFHFDSIKEG